MIETPANPLLGVVDIRRVARLAHENDCLLIVDSTFAPPPIQQPLALGADLVVHSLTKYINGHGDTLGGSVCGQRSLVDRIRYPGMACFTGAALSPFSAWLIMRGMETLDLRVRRHCENALAIARYLEGRGEVESVIYPALESHPQHALCETQMNGMGGGIVSLWLKDGVAGRPRRENDYRFCDALQIITVATSLGEAHTLIQVENSDMLRIAVGLENAADLTRDLGLALDHLTGGKI